MREHRSPTIPPAHRAFRVLILAALTATALLAVRSGPVERAVTVVLHTDRRITVTIWAPLQHGGGWAAPLLPALPSPSPAHPSGSPAATRAPAPSVPTPGPSRKPTKR